MGGSSAPKPPKPTAEELAMRKRTEIDLREETARTERKLKAQARGKLGVKSLLTGIEPDTSKKQSDVKHSKAKARKTYKKVHPWARRFARIGATEAFGGVDRD